jgi:parallel beta-helix repeat protein
MKDCFNNDLSNNNFTSNEVGIYLAYSSFNNISNNFILNNKIGVFVDYFSNDNILKNNWMDDNIHGVTVRYSDDNQFLNCDFSENFFESILFVRSRNNIVSNSSVNNNSAMDGIKFQRCFSNHIFNCDIQNNWRGIDFDSFSMFNHIEGCSLLNNYWGCKLSNSKFNKIEKCLFQNNTGGLVRGINNIIMNNNFIDNLRPYFCGWDHTNLFLRNYWNARKIPLPIPYRVFNLNFDIFPRVFPYEHSNEFTEKSKIILDDNERLFKEDSFFSKSEYIRRLEYFESTYINWKESKQEINTFNGSEDIFCHSKLKLLNQKFLVQEIGSLDGKILYVGGSGPGNYSLIQEAINDAEKKDTIYVYNGTYNEHLLINKPLQIFGENKFKTIINGTASILFTDNVTLSSFTIKTLLGRGYGSIEISSSENCKIHGNIITDSSDTSAISLFNSSSTKIISNIITVGKSDGLLITFSRDTIVERNYINNNRKSIDIQDSVNTNIENNTIEENIIGITVANCSAITINKNQIRDNDYFGLNIDQSNEAIILKNNISNNQDTAIYISFSTLNYISENKIVDNSHTSVEFYNVNFSYIFNNTISNSTYEGISLVMSSNNHITQNNVQNLKNGVILDSSSTTNITFNEIKNSIVGLIIMDSGSNAISKNDFISNFDKGIDLYKSSDNRISNNNFIDNKNHACFEDCNNTWSGNYWGRPRYFPYPIFGRADKFLMPDVNFDWNPLKEPYE